MVVCSGLVIPIVCRVALMGMFQIRFVKLDDPVEKGVKGLMSGESAAPL